MRSRDQCCVQYYTISQSLSGASKSLLIALWNEADRYLAHGLVQRGGSCCFLRHRALLGLCGTKASCAVCRVHSIGPGGQGSFGPEKAEVSTGPLSLVHPHPAALVPLFPVHGSQHQIQSPRFLDTTIGTRTRISYLYLYSYSCFVRFQFVFIFLSCSFSRLNGACPLATAAVAVAACGCGCSGRASAEVVEPLAFVPGYRHCPHWK